MDETDEQQQKLAKANQRILRQHFRTHGKFAKSAEKIQRAIDGLLNKELEAENPDIWRLEKLAATLGHAEKVVGKSIEGQRAAASLDYEDINRAYTKLKREGYEVMPIQDYKQLVGQLPEPEPPEPEGGWFQFQLDENVTPRL